MKAHERAHEANGVPAKRGVATDDGEARIEVWAPPDRGNTRPDHAFRAGLLDFLKGKRVEREVRAAIVGQHDNVETRHYSDHTVLLDVMREAIELIPPIDWFGAAASKGRPDNVLPLRAAQSS